MRWFNLCWLFNCFEDHIEMFVNQKHFFFTSGFAICYFFFFSTWSNYVAGKKPCNCNFLSRLNPSKSKKLFSDNHHLHPHSRLVDQRNSLCIWMHQKEGKKDIQRKIWMEFIIWQIILFNLLSTKIPLTDQLTIIYEWN